MGKKIRHRGWVEKFSGSKAPASFAVSNRMRKKDKLFFLLRHKDDVT
jgi:hypothetical protein